MHDLDRSDLVFESDGFDTGIEELEETSFNDEEVFDSGEQSELASELLGVSSDEELDHFLGDLIKGAAAKLGPISKHVTKHLGGLLKGAVKKALPTVASLAGGALGGPAGALIASKATPYLSSILGMELEGLSPEDQEFEAAKQLVRLAGNAVQNVVGAGNYGNPAQVARQAVVDAARQFAPGLVRRAGDAIASRIPGGATQQGTWYRRGNQIIIVGV